MAALSDAKRREILKELIDGWSGNREAVGSLTKADIQAAINALDTWIDGNASTVNTTIPQPARAQLTSLQKAKLFYFVARKRYQET